ncbi:SIS domain-containing protein [Paenibacillus psychroresistens]|uniref:SIS domain-containing protein n=1 Tax=Paenibacillus psychroresistens TaxID=1778678 RepID=A0A6B8RMK4_9BACL|nr:SIS domain-containing protein [Paenibacillus psychroresistens]QGQ97520.1 SIS domain-containing protein [Paenibacillus psychroresistens]
MEIEMELSMLIHRSGGMNCFKRLGFNFTYDNDVRKRTKDMDQNHNLEGLIPYLLNASNVHWGDVLFIGSVSGKSVFPIHLAIHARELGNNKSCGQLHNEAEFRRYEETGY